MPRFKTEFRAELIEPFKSLGMSKVFDPAQSDLSGLTGKPRDRSAIDDRPDRASRGDRCRGSRHRGRGRDRGRGHHPHHAPRRRERFQIDRPFMFLIADDKTGAILFQGRISDPRN